MVYKTDRNSFENVITLRHKGAEKGKAEIMKIEQLPIDKLKPAEYNPRKISRQELEKLKKGIKEFGMVDPLIVNADMTVIGGHQRLKAVESLKWQDVPCVVLDISKDKEKLLNLSLNRISGEWDDEKLQELIAELTNMPIDLDLAGFDTKEILEQLGDSLEEKQEEIKPFTMSHVLISFPPDKLILIQEYLEKIIEIKGVEYEQTAN